ncbi:MAG: glycosyltransferase family 1 protein [Rubrivivax sp.]
MDPTRSDDAVVENYPAAQRPLRLAVVTETWPPEVNGVATTIAQLVQGLQRRHHELQLVRPRQAPADAAGHGVRFHEVLMRGLPIPRYPQLRMGLPARRQLVQLWSRQRPDAVHIATEGPLGFSALQAARHLKLVVTSDFRTNFHAYSRHYGIGWLRRPIMAYLRSFHSRCAVTMVPTEPLRRELQGEGFSCVQVVARGIDTRLFHPARRSAALRASWGVGDDDLVVACVGRLAPEKNLPALLKAFDAIVRDQPRARLLLVGEGPLRAVLAAAQPQAILAGQRRGEDLAAHYASADLFVFPSLTETFGNVTGEAMASGLPVLAYDHAGAAQLIRAGDSGVLAPFGDEAEFVRSARQMAGSAAWRQALGRGARQRAAGQGWDEIVARFEAVLLQAIKQQACAGPRGFRAATAA